MRKYFLIFWAVLKLIILRKKTPLFVGFALTNNCNLKCKYCETYHFKEKELSFTKIKKMLHELANAGCIHLWLTGGEPLLHKNIKGIINEAKKLHFKISIATNGYFLKKHLSAIKKLNDVNISLDGPEKIHDGLRGKGSYKKAMSAIALLKNNRIRFSITTVINELNYLHLKKLSDFAKTNKIKTTFQYVDTNSFTNNSHKIGKLILKNNHQKYVEKTLLELKKHNKYLDISSILNSNKFNAQKCLAGKIYFRITAGGKLLCCWRQNNNTPVDLTKYSLEEALNLLPPPICTHCNKYHGLKLFKTTCFFNPFSVKYFR